jgi:hypothetical protein
MLKSGYKVAGIRGTTRIDLEAEYGILPRRVAVHRKLMNSLGDLGVSVRSLRPLFDNGS